MDTIFIREFRVDAWVGIYDWEKLRPQTLELEVEIGIPGTAAGKSDDIHDTVHYGQVVERFTAELAARRFGLLEALADVFAVPVAYFSDDYLGRVTNDLLPILVAAQDPTVRALLHRSDLPDVAAVLASVEQSAPTPQLIELLSRADLQDVVENLTNPDVLAWVGDRPLADVLATLQAPVVQSAIEETLAVWLKYGTGPRK